MPESSKTALEQLQAQGHGVHLGLRDIDPPTAVEMYEQLIAEYPNSPWADLAKARTKLIDWYLKDKPDTLINERKSQALYL